MPPVERVIRRLPRRASSALDDRPHLVQVVLVVWAILLTLLVVALGGFDETRLWHNGWFRLAGVVATWGLLAWAAATPGRWMANRLRLGVAASLAAHTVLALMLLYAQLAFTLTPPEPDVERRVVVEPEETPRLVERVQPATEQQPIFEQLMPTDRLTQQLPRSERTNVAPAELSQQEPDPPDPATRPQPQSLAERPPRQAPAHRASERGQRRRQQELAAVASAAPAEPTTAPNATVATSQPEPAPSARHARATADAPATPTELTEDSVTAEAPIARRSRSDAPQVAERTAASRVRRTPSTAIDTAEAAVSPRPSTVQATREPADPTPREQPRAPTTAATDVPDPQIERDTPPTPIARRDTAAAELPLAASPTPLDRRRPVNVATAVDLTPQTREAADITRSDAEVERPNEPVGPRLNRARDTSRLATAESLPDDPQQVNRPRPAPQPARRQATTAAAVSPPTREHSETTAALPRDPSVAEAMTAAVPEASTREASTSPAPRVLADSRGGTGRRGEGQNLLDDTPAAPELNAPFAAAAAERNRRAQTKRGPALVPVPVAERAQGRAAATSPSSTLMPTPGSAPQVAATTRPQEASVSSSAAVERQYANASLGDLTADRGEAEFDTGPPQVAPERGNGRGASGGRLATRTSDTRRGLGPRRPAPATMSADAAIVAEPSTATPATAPDAASVAEREVQPGGGANESAVGRVERATVARLEQGRAPAGTTSGGGVSPPSTGPRTAARQRGDRRRGGSGSASSQGAAGPSIATGGSTGRTDGRTGRLAAAVVGSDSSPAAVAAPASSSTSTAGQRLTAAAGSASAAPESAVPKRRTELPAEPGIGGLAVEAVVEPGLPDRLARRQTTTVRLAPSRFANRREGGQPNPPGRRREPAPAYAARTDRSDTSPATGVDSLRPKSEAAIEMGLAFLATLQQEDGRWSLGEFKDLPIADEELPTMRADGAATGMALLAFLGGGYDHYDDKYRAVVQQGLDYLIREQGDEGDLFPERDDGDSKLRFYSHGIAALALCEAYGMTGDPELRGPAQRALDYITATQHPQLDGWRYFAGQDTDLSVAGWQVMALRSGELAGLEVDPQSYRRMARLLNECRQTDGNVTLYSYNPYRADVARYRRPSTVMTAVGVLMELYLGENRTSTQVQRGARHLARHQPMHPDQYTWAPIGTQGNPQRDTYYWYYATQVMFHMGGDDWQTWHDRLYPLLIRHQTQEGPLAGSWNPRLPVPDRHAYPGGRLYVTCLNLLSLEVSYRHLPLYEMTAQ